MPDQQIQISSSLNNSKSSDSVISNVVIYDPMYDAVSKKLFDDTYRYRVGDTWYNSGQNFINFVNSIFYPTAKDNDFQIRKIKPISAKSISDQCIIKSKSLLDTSTDCAYECTCYALDSSNESTYIFNLEMQRSQTTGQLQNFNDRMLHYTSSLFDVKYKYDPFVPVRGLVIIDDIVNPNTQIISNNFISQYVQNHQIVNAEIASDKVISIYIQLPAFVSKGKFIANRNIEYSILDKIYCLSNEAINWLKLYCAHRYGLPSSPRKYKISLDANSKAYIGAKLIEQMDDALEIAIAQEEKSKGIQQDFITQIKLEGKLQGRLEGILEGILEGRLESKLKSEAKFKKMTAKQSVRNCFDTYARFGCFDQMSLNAGLRYEYIQLALSKYRCPYIEQKQSDDKKVLFLDIVKDQQYQGSILSIYSQLTEE
ncbi:Hypothetical_protein [Hexamita inflata]|uniref:Hypothetical_protein n=1 Tax=Hexamita inflata TaxID=28002 RepID=A0AA86P9V4_9EUKA|nr:Hypothetical protein HINF_LOCUS22392 [Hexamita inflata]